MNECQHTHSIHHIHTHTNYSFSTLFFLSALYITASLSPYTNPSNHALHTHAHTRLTSHCNSFVTTLLTCVFPSIFGFGPLFFPFAFSNSFNKTIIYVSIMKLLLIPLPFSLPPVVCFLLYKSRGSMNVYK